MEQALRRTGIEVIGDAPWGTHFCQFYETKQDLLEILVPYFRQGLADNEFCMWVTSEPVEAGEARAALADAEPSLDDFVRQGRIEILDYRDWYTRGGSFDAERVLQGWLDKLEGASARGLEGLRLTGNTFWLERKDWAGFTAYEEAVNRVICNYRMLAVCTYSLERCGALEIMDVLANHRFALVKREGRWQTVESSERRLADQRYSEADRIARRLTQFPLQNPNPVLRVAFDGTLLFSNEPARKWLAALGWRAPEPLPATLLAVAEQARTAGRPTETEVACPAEKTYFLTAARPPQEDYVNCYAIDITQRKQAEVALQRSEALLRSVLEQMPSGVTVREASSGKLLLSNPRSEEILGSLAASQGEFARYRGQHPDGRPYRLEEWPLSRSMAKGEVVQAEQIDCERSDGLRLTLTVGSAPIRDPDGRIAAVVGIFHDITERRRIERQYSTLFDATSDGIWIQNLNGEILEVNDAYCRMSGYSREELKGMQVSRLEVAEGPGEVAAHLRRLIEGGGHDRFESRHQRKDGSLFDVDITALYFDKVLGRIAIFTRDITQRKEAEEALRESETRLRRFYESGLVGILYWRTDGEITDANDKFLQMVGYSRQELSTGQLNWRRLTPPEYRRRDEESLAELQAIGFNKNPFEKEYIRKDGTRVPVLVGGARQDKGASGVAIVVDISELKQAEEALRQSREDLNRAQEVGQIGSWRLDVRSDVLSWSDEAYRIFGVPKGTPQTYETFLQSVHPDDRQRVDAEWKAALAGRPYDIEHRLLAGGQVKWVRERAFLELDGAGQLLGGFGIAQDITERKRAEQALKESYAELDRFNRAMIGREARMIELKKQVNELRLKSGQAPLYPLDFEK
jgi:PAS domain S-box-containing protein